MRLPSQPNDPNEFLRHTSMASDGPEEIVLAEEYVNDVKRRKSEQPPNFSHTGGMVKNVMQCDV